MRARKKLWMSVRLAPCCDGLHGNDLNSARLKEIVGGRGLHELCCTVLPIMKYDFNITTRLIFPLIQIISR